jgi:hypothetical protein
MEAAVSAVARDRTSRGRGHVAARTLVVGLLIVGSACAVLTPPATLPSPSPPSESLLPVTHWQALFDQDAAALDEGSRRLSLSTDSSDYMALSYDIDAYTSMFEATGEARYADVALEYVDNVVNSARPSRSISTSQFRDSYRGWVSLQPGLRGQEVALYESYIWRYVTRLLRVLRASTLYDNPAYRRRFDAVLTFSELHIFRKWHLRGAEDFIYRSRTHMAAHWAYIALELSVLTTDDARRGRYRDVVDAIDNSLPNYPSSLRGQLRPAAGDPAAFWWSDVWGETTGPGQDIAHGNGVISYVVESHDLDAGWSEDELARFSRTLTSFVLGSGGVYPEYVDGSGRGNGWIADGFVKLGRLDPALQAVLENYEVQNSQYHAAMALNAKLLGVDGAR